MNSLNFMFEFKTSYAGAKNVNLYNLRLNSRKFLCLFLVLRLFKNLWFRAKKNKTKKKHSRFVKAGDNIKVKENWFGQFPNHEKDKSFAKWKIFKNHSMSKPTKII